MTTDLATVPRLAGPPELAGRNREAPRPSPPGSGTPGPPAPRRSYGSTWKPFQAWAEAGGHAALPAAPQAVALHLGHLAAIGWSLSSIELARAAISNHHVAAGIHKINYPARHPVVAEAVQGWRNRAPAPRQADALTYDALAWVRQVVLLPRRGRGGRMESLETAHRRASLDLAIVGVLADGLGDGLSGRIGMARRMVAAGAPNAAVQPQGRWKHGNMVTRYTRGEAVGEFLKGFT